MLLGLVAAGAFGDASGAITEHADICRGTPEVSSATYAFDSREAVGTDASAADVTPSAAFT